MYSEILEKSAAYQVERKYQEDRSNNFPDQSLSQSTLNLFVIPINTVQNVIPNLLQDYNLMDEKLRTEQETYLHINKIKV